MNTPKTYTLTPEAQTIEAMAVNEIVEFCRKHIFTRATWEREELIQIDADVNAGILGVEEIINGKLRLHSGLLAYGTLEQFDAYMTETAYGRNA